MNHYQIISQIKNQVENKKQKKYQRIKQKSNQKYYELYLSSLIFIQRQWRKHLVLKNKKLQQFTLKNIQRFSQNQTKNQILKIKLKQLKNKKHQLQNMNPNIKVQQLKSYLQNQLKNSISNVFQRADKYAKIKAVLQSQAIGYNQIFNQNEELKNTCQKSALQNQLLQHKNKKLIEKIRALKHIITADKTEIILLKEQNQKFSFIKKPFDAQFC